MAFLPPKNPGVRPVMPEPDPTAMIFSKLDITHKHRVCLFNKYHTVDRARKKVISQLIPKKYYKFLSSQIIGFERFTSLHNFTRLINKYVKLEDDDIQEIDRKMK